MAFDTALPKNGSTNNDTEYDTPKTAAYHALMARYCNKLPSGVYVWKDGREPKWTAAEWRVYSGYFEERVERARSEAIRAAMDAENNNTGSPYPPRGVVVWPVPAKSL